ncbi:MAG: rod shape-determining protein MreD [Elusimicrobiota bacterium]
MFKKAALFIILIIAVSVLETVGVYFIPVYAVMPQLFVILVIFFAWWNGPLWGETIGFFSGLVFDALGFGIFGINMLLFTILGYTVGNVSINMDKEDVTKQIVIVFIMSYIYIAISYIVQLVSLYPERSNVKLLYWIKPFFNAVWTPLVFWAFRTIGNRWLKINIKNVAK